MNLKGWDVISFTPVKNINTVIKQNWKELTFNAKRDNIELYGSFGEWSIVPGGGGKFIRMHCPISSGRLIMEGNELKLDGMIAVFQVMLNFFDQISATRQNADYNLLNLTFDFKIAFPLTESGNPAVPAEVGEEIGGIVQPIDLLNCTSLKKYIILNMLADYLVEHTSIFQPIFAAVTLKGRFGTWISPVKCRYSFLDSANPYIAILAVCTDRDISNLPLDVDVAGIDLNSGQSYYAISKGLFVKNVGIPCFTTMFQSSANDYMLVDDILTNQNRVTMPSITVGAIDYSPYVNARHASIWIVGNTLHVDLDQGDCDLRAGINMAWSSYNSFSCTFENGALKFTKTASSFTHNEDIPWYLRFIPLSFIIDICVDCISDSLASGISVKIDIKSAALNDIHWYGAQTNITSAFLNDGLVISYS